MTQTFFPGGPGLPALPAAPAGPGEPWGEKKGSGNGAPAMLRKASRGGLLFFMSSPTAPGCFLNEEASHPWRETSRLNPDDSGYSLGESTTRLHLQGHHCPYGASERNRKGALNYTHTWFLSMASMLQCTDFC